MTWKECRYLINSDLRRLTNAKWGGVKYLFFNASFRITFWFRIGSYLRTKRNPLYRFLYGIVFLIHKHNQYLTGIQLPLETVVGKGLCFSHFSCIVINSSAIIGDNCTIFQGVTVGSKRGPKGGVPRIGNNVVLASGAKLIGRISIGDNVMVGANATVVTDIPNNAVAVGCPAKVISFHGKENTQLYYNN